MEHDPLEVSPEDAAWLTRRARADAYSQNVKLRQLLDMDDAEIIERHDVLLDSLSGNSIMGADEYRAEYYRRATLKAAQASEDYNRRIDHLLIALAVLAIVPLVLDLWDRFHWGDHVGPAWAALRALGGP